PGMIADQGRASLGWPQRSRRPETRETVPPAQASTHGRPWRGRGGASRTSRSGTPFPCNQPPDRLPWSARGVKMRRREFIAGLGAAAWPLAAGGQQAVPLLGFLLSGAPPFPPVLGTAFLRGLKEFGYAEHVNVRIEYRWANDDPGRLPGLAAD